MVRLLIYVLVALAAWQYFERQSGPEVPVVADAGSASANFPPREPRPVPAAAPQFHCDGRQYCSQMNSREEAEYFVSHCPNTKMDGDHDGEPCERDSRF